MSTRLRTRSVVMLLSLVMLVSESVSSVASPSGAASPLGLSAAAPSRIAGCALLPSSNVWNTPVSNLPVAANSAAVVAAIGAGSPLHPDFGSGTWAGSPIGIPYSVVPSTQAGVSVHFSYSSESDHGPYPVPAHPKNEGGRSGTGDRHVLLVLVLLYGQGAADAWMALPHQARKRLKKDGLLHEPALHVGQKPHGNVQHPPLQLVGCVGADLADIYS